MVFSLGVTSLDKCRESDVASFSIPDMPRYILQFTLDTTNQLLHLGKLVVVLQTLRVEQSSRRLDFFARNNSLDWQFYLLEVDRRLCFQTVSSLYLAPAV